MSLVPPNGDEPIVPRVELQPYAAEVIDLDGVRIRWGMPVKGRYHPDTCKHHDLTYSVEERRVWCLSCNRTIENFDAFRTLVDAFGRMEAEARRKIDKANEAMTAAIHRRATKAVDKAWSSSLPAISCPHCYGGILPEDWVDGPVSRASREFEMARRARAKP